jgi:predicted O-methyltransferase YrrM
MSNLRTADGSEQHGLEQLKRAFKSLERSGKNVLRSLFVPGAIRALQNAAAKMTTLEQAVALCSEFEYRHIRLDPSQVTSEILQLLNLLRSRPPKTILEIGTYRGGTFFLFSRVAASDALLISLDLPPDRFGHGYPAWRSGFFRSFAREQQKIELLLADSHQPATLGQVQTLLGGRKLDFLFIDGDHSYEGVKADYEMYSPLVGSGGWIAFHDIVPRKIATPNEVPRFWQQLKQSRPVTEFVADWDQDGFGIGVIGNGQDRSGITQGQDSSAGR